MSTSQKPVVDGAGLTTTAQPLLTAAQRWSIVEQAQAARWRAWGRCPDYIPLTVAIQLDLGDHEFLVGLVAAWDQFMGSLWLADPGAIAEEWVRLTYYHSTWFGWSARRVPAAIHQRWAAELDPFRPVAAAASDARRRGGLAPISVEERRAGADLANAALAIRRQAQAGGGLHLHIGSARKYLTPREIRDQELAMLRSAMRQLDLEDARNALFNTAQLRGKPH